MSLGKTNTWNRWVQRSVLPTQCFTSDSAYLIGNCYLFLCLYSRHLISRRYQTGLYWICNSIVIQFIRKVSHAVDRSWTPTELCFFVMSNNEIKKQETKNKTAFDWRIWLESREKKNTLAFIFIDIKWFVCCDFQTVHVLNVLLKDM